jgi:hypothetical protein
MTRPQILDQLKEKGVTILPEEQSLHMAKDYTHLSLEEVAVIMEELQPWLAKASSN